MESVAALGSKRTCATRLWPAARVAGRELTTVNAPVEVLRSAIVISERLVFVIDTVLDAVLPTLTLPNSIVDGLMEISADVVLVDENAPASDPHPDNPRQIDRVVARTAATVAVCLWDLFVSWAISK